jgi:glutamate-1-semialdehyde 2,1-aminomutase
MKDELTWKQRAAKVIPGGMYGHQSTWRLPEAFPQFIERGKAGHIWDTNGKRYIDFMSSYGPIILGHAHPKVEEAVSRQLKNGDCFNGPSTSIVELAEKMTAIVDHADWCIFAKNGTDATTICVSVARAYTGKNKILVAQGAYHGAAPWCTPLATGTTPEDKKHLISYRFNDIESVEGAIEKAGDDLAGILVSAFKHDNVVDQEMPGQEFATHIRKRCDELDAALIIDEVRAGLRLTEGASWELLGIEPDLTAWSKAIANGYALAAILGSEKYMRAARSVFTTGSFWFAAASMVAAMTTLDLVREEEVVKRINNMGQRFREGVQQQADALNISISQSGPPQMPLILFNEDEVQIKERGDFFTNEAMKLGLYLHPRHNMFLNGGHTEKDIDDALEITDSSFKALKSRFY